MSIYLHPLDSDAFTKHINIANNQRAKIGRQRNAGTASAENNGYFDFKLKVLSRQYVDVWEEKGKVGQ